MAANNHNAAYLLYSYYVIWYNEEIHEFCNGELIMRKIIAALQTSLDGFIEGPNGELDWAMAEDQET